jgi:peptide/nickel transport system substrate-binding protein
MRSRAISSITCWLALTAFLVACGQPAPSPAPAKPTSPPTVAAAPTSAAAPIAPAPTQPAASGTTVAKPAPTPAAAQAAGGTLTVTVADLGSDITDVIIPVVNVFTPLIYEPLLRYDQQGNLVGWLAESYSMAPGGRLWTFNLRKGVKWSNGDEFTSDDVKFNIERYVSDASPSAWSPLHRQTVERVETPDKYTVQVYAKDPPYMFYPDAIQGSMVIPKNYFEKVGLATFTKQPVGTGPWVLSKFTSGVSAELTANKEYWGAKPVWDKLVILQVPEESTRIAVLKRGEADIVGVSNDNAIKLRDADGYQLRQTKAATVPSLFLTGYYLQPGPTSDVRVREAMDLAMNRQEIVDSFFRGFGKPGAGVTSLSELHWGFDPIWYSIKYDPARSKQLLQEAGYPGKFADPVIRIFSTIQGSAGWEPDLVQLISGYWEAVGIRTEIIPMDFTAYRSAWVGKDPKIMGGVAPWMGIGSGSAANNIPAMQNHMTSKGVNISANDPQLDKDFFAMTAELDANKRLAMWHSVQQQAFALHSVLGIARVYDQYAVSNKVGDWTGIDHQSGGNSAFILGLTGVQHR